MKLEADGEFEFMGEKLTVLQLYRSIPIEADTPYLKAKRHISKQELQLDCSFVKFKNETYILLDISDIIYLNEKESLDDIIKELEINDDKTLIKLLKIIFYQVDFQDAKTIHTLQYFLEKSVPPNNIHFKDCTVRFKQDVNLVFQDTHLDNTIIVLEGHKNEESYGSLQFKNCTFHQKFKIRNEEQNDPYNNKANIKELNFTNCVFHDNMYFRIGYLEIGDFEIRNLRNPPNSEVNLGELKCTNFTIINFRNMGKMKLYEIHPRREGETTFNINNTSIGDADFQSISINDFDKVILYDNLFHNLVYSNVRWSDKLSDKNEKEISNEKLLDAYRVLKNTAKKNQDTEYALKFYAKEMECLKDKLVCDPSSSSLDVCTLRYNQYTNNFGLTWQRPLVVLAILSASLYCCLLLSLALNIHDYGNWKHFWTFLNPTHKTEFICKDLWTGWTYFWDFSFRIIEGLLFYQTITAFRKFSKGL